jgi:peroxiredoxin
LSQFPTKTTAVLGVSADTIQSHKQFVTNEHLNFPLLADPQKQTIAAYGVLGNNGYAQRVTFVIGPDGLIRHIDRTVNAEFSRANGTLTTRHGQNLALLLSDWRAQIGKPIPNVSLADANGKTISLLPSDKKAAVVAFLSAGSPPSQVYAARLRALALNPAYKDVAFAGIYPNATAQAIRADAARQQLPFPAARDANGTLANHFQVRVTPTVWVLDAQGIAVYEGAIDDSVDPAQVKTAYLQDALDAVLAGRPVVPSETKAIGTPIRHLRKK